MLGTESRPSETVTPMPQGIPERRGGGRGWGRLSGRAIDLFLGGQRREHEDLEIAVPGTRFDELVPALDGFEIYVITDQADGATTGGNVFR